MVVAAYGERIVRAGSSSRSSVVRARVAQAKKLATAGFHLPLIHT